MMRCLLEVNFCPILAIALVSLTEYRVKRLDEHVVVEEPAEIRCHNQLQSLDWIVRSRRSLVHKDWHRGCKASHSHEHRLR